MPIIPLPGRPAHSPPSLSDERSIHHELIKKNLPAWLINSSAARVKQLKGIKPVIADWHQLAPAAEQRHLAQAMKRAWTAQNDIDKALHNLQDVYAFAKPLLQNALKDRFGVEDDVEQTWLRLYAPSIRLGGRMILRAEPPAAPSRYWTPRCIIFPVMSNSVRTRNSLPAPTPAVISPSSHSSTDCRSISSNHCVANSTWARVIHST
jgi:hypothetical protein